MSPCPIRVGFGGLVWDFLRIPLRETPRVLILVVFNAFTFHLIFHRRAPTLQSLPKLLSRRVLRSTSICIDEVRSRKNPST